MLNADATTVVSPRPALQQPYRLRPWTWSRRSQGLALGVMLLLTAAGLAFWRYHAAPGRYLREGMAALDRSDMDEAERYALLLEGRGRNDAAHFLRGKAHVLAGRELLRQAVVLARREQVDQGLLLLLDVSGQLVQPFSVRPDVVCQEHSVLAPWTRWRPAQRQRREMDERIRAAFQSGLRELAHLKTDSPFGVEAAALSGDCCFRLGELRQAANLLDFVVQQRPDDIDSHRLLASLYFDLGAMGQAAYHAKEVARLDLEDGRAHRLIGSINKDFRNIHDAAIAYREALGRRLSPAARAEVVRELAELLVDDLGQHREALDVLAQCPAEFAEMPDIWVLRANCLWQLSADKSEATRLADAALAVQPDMPMALLLRAQLYLHYEQPEPAIALLERARRQDPFDYKIRSQLAGAYQLRTRQADDAVLRAAALDALAGSTDGLGAAVPMPALIGLASEAAQRQVFQYLKEDHELASNLIKQHLVELTRRSRQAGSGTAVWDAQIRYEIAAIWMQMDRPAMARMWLNAALVCDPEHRAAQQAMQELEKQGTPRF
jgi:tetratricopeptide (TPR) repeat protein